MSLCLLVSALLLMSALSLIAALVIGRGLAACEDDEANYVATPARWDENRASVSTRPRD